MVIHKISAYGNSYHVSVPRRYLEAAGLSLGDLVRVELGHNSEIVISKLELKPRASAPPLTDKQIEDRNYGKPDNTN